MSSPTAAAGDSGFGSKNVSSSPSSRPDSPSMRPSWPAPSTPTRAPKLDFVRPLMRCPLAARIGLVEHGLRARLPIGVKRLADFRILAGDDRSGEQAGVDGARFADRQGADGNAG